MRLQPSIQAVLVATLLAVPLHAFAEPFEVLLLRGGEVVRVTGDERGPLAEEIVRPAPPPLAPEPEPEPVREPPERPTTIIVLQPQPPGGWVPVIAPGHLKGFRELRGRPGHRPRALGSRGHARYGRGGRLSRGRVR